MAKFGSDELTDLESRNHESSSLLCILLATVFTPSFPKEDLNFYQQWRHDLRQDFWADRLRLQFLSALCDDWRLLPEKTSSLLHELTPRTTLAVSHKLYAKVFEVVTR